MYFGRIRIISHFNIEHTKNFIRDHENKLYLAKPRTEYLKRSLAIAVLSCGMTFQIKRDAKPQYSIKLYERDTQIYFQIGFPHGNYEKQLAVQFFM